ncbi:MAG TPA: hypothetical protein VIK95_14785 [Egibacteraceae bacterium]
MRTASIGRVLQDVGGKMSGGTRRGPARRRGRPVGGRRRSRRGAPRGVGALVRRFLR